MTLSNTNTRMDFVGNGAVSNYSFTFKIFANSHLKVTQRDTDDVETLLVLDTDYTVTGAGDTAGGSITLTAGNLPSDYVLTIRRVVPVTQETDFRNQGDFFPDIHEDQFDLTTMIEQQLGEETGRTITLPETVSGVDTELPVPAALKWFRYNSGATAFELVDAADFSTLMTTVDTSLTIASSNLSVTHPHRIVSAGGAVDVITGTSSPAAASLTNGLAVVLEAAGANATTTPTFNLDGLGAKTIVKGNGLALAVGDIPGANYRAHLAYDLSLTQWILVNPFTTNEIQAGKLTYIADTGAADVYVATLVPAATVYTDGMEIDVKIANVNATTTPTLNVNGLGAKTIKRGNSAALTVGDLPVNHQATLRYNGTDFILQNPALHNHSAAGEGGTLSQYSPQLQTEVATTSGTTHDFTGIPSWVSKITIMLVGVSTDGTSIPMIQLGDSGGFETTGYVGAVSDIAAAVASSNLNTGFVIAQGSAAAAVRHGSMILTLEDATNNVWVAQSAFGRTDTAETSNMAGSKPLSGVLTQVRLTTVNGTDAFDAGAINVTWE